MAYAIAICHVSCSVDDAYDLSKDVDMTVAVGKGLSIPLGSTEKIKLTEMIDPEESDVVEVDDNGFYSIRQSGDIDKTVVKVNGTTVHINPEIEGECYKFKTKQPEISDLDEYPEDVKQDIIDKIKVPVSIKHYEIKHEAEFPINEEVPEEMIALKRMEFENSVTMVLDFLISASEKSDFFDYFKKMHFYPEGESEYEHFTVELPSYIDFKDHPMLHRTDDGKQMLWLDQMADFNEDKGGIHYTTSLEIKALDFSSYEGGCVEINRGILDLNEELKIRGALTSDTVIVPATDLMDEIDVTVTPTVVFDEFVISRVEGKFNPVIEDVNEVIEVDLGDDMDFIYDATLDFNNPQIYVTLNSSDVTVPVVANVSLTGCGNNVENSVPINLALNLYPNTDNKFYLTPSGASLAGYTSVTADLNSILQPVPRTVGLKLQAAVDSGSFCTVELDKEMEVSGTYDLVLPMDFNELDLTYTETVEDVLGDDPEEVTDYVTEIESVTVNADVLNTVPASFTPTIVAYDANGNKLNDIHATLVGEDGAVEKQIKPGNGYKNGKLTEPVASSFKIKLTAKNNQLKDLNTLDIKLHGIGSGVLNENEYLQITKLSIVIDEPVIVDMN